MRREPRVIGASLSIVASSSSISTAARTLSRVRQPAGRVAVVQCCASIHHRQALTHLSSWLHIKEEEAARSTFFWFGSYSKAIPSTPSSPIHILSQSPSLSLSLSFAFSVSMQSLLFLTIRVYVLPPSRQRRINSQRNNRTGISRVPVRARRV